MKHQTLIVRAIKALYAPHASADLRGDPVTAVVTKPLRLLAGALALLVGASELSAQPAHGLLLRGEAAESFLKTAKVVRKKAIGVGITLPYQLTLTDGSHTLKAVWKTIDEFKRGVTQFQQGGFEVD